MKRFVCVITAALMSSPVLAQSHVHTDAKTESKAAAHKASGTVKKVDAAKGRVTIAHGPVESLKWPKMTMAFTVKDKKLLDKLPVDKNVDFEFVQQGKDYVVTSVK